MRDILSLKSWAEPTMQKSSFLDTPSLSLGGRAGAVVRQPSGQNKSSISLRGCDPKRRTVRTEEQSPGRANRGSGFH